MARYPHVAILVVYAAFAAMLLACADLDSQSAYAPSQFPTNNELAEPRPASSIHPPVPKQPPDWCWAVPDTRDAPECRGYHRPQIYHEEPDIPFSDDLPFSCRMFLIGCPDQPPYCVWFRDWHMIERTGEFVDWRGEPYRVCFANPESVPDIDVPDPRYAGGRAYSIPDSLQTRCHRCRTLARECRDTDDQHRIPMCPEGWRTCFAETGGTCSPPDSPATRRY